MSSAYRKSLLVILALAMTAPASADLLVVGDSFATGSGRSASAPLDGLPTQRGHRVWQASAGVTLEEGGLATSSPGDVAGLRFSFLDHPYAARAVVDTVLDPGDAGWVGVGFADTARTPLPQSGQVWVELSANGQLTVRANGSRHRLYKDAHAHPAFVDGPNRIRLQYDRATNSVRLWMNRVEVELEEPDLDVFGFTPDIRLAGFQGHFRQRGQKAAGAVIQTFNVNLGEEDLADTFTLGGVRGLVNGALLDGVPIETGGVTWSATGSTMLGNGFITNHGNATDPKAGVPFNPAEHPGYRAAAVEAVADVAGAGGWFGLGFTNAPAESLWNSGLVWVLIQSDGRVKVNIEGTGHNLYNVLLNPTLPAHVALEYDRVSNSVRAWVNGQELALTSNLVDHQYTPAITHASFHRFTSTQPFPTSGLFYLDDFAVTLTPVEPLGFVVGPTGVTVPEHDDAEMICAATGGFPPYSYHWEKDRFGCMVMPQKALPGWTDVADGNGISGSQTDTLRFDPVDLAHESCYRCVVTDSNTVPSTLASGSANLNVREVVARDEFDNYTTPPPTEPLNTRVTPIGGLAWSSRSGLQILNDRVTNLVASQAGGQVAGLPIDPAWVNGYRTIAVEADVEIPLSSGWMGLGFSRSGSATDYRYDGQIYLRIDANGRASVIANGQAHTLYQGPTPDPSFRSGQLNHLKVQYDTETHVVKAWLNGTELPLTTPDLDTVGFAPNLAYAGMNVFRNFYGADQWHGTSFTVSVDSVVPPPVFSAEPEVVITGLGFSPSMSCVATGGVGDLSFVWQRSPCDEVSCDPFEQLTPAPGNNISISTVPDPATGGFRSTLTLSDVDKSDEGWIRCTVTDSALTPRVKYSGSAWLGVEYPDIQIADLRTVAPLELINSGGASVSESAPATPYTLSFDLSWEPNKLHPSKQFPVRVIARCHDPGVHEGPSSWREATVGTHWIQAGSGAGATVNLSIPASCMELGGGHRPWGVLSLRLDANIDPTLPGNADCGTQWDAYPCLLETGNGYLPESDFGWDNRGELLDWMPISFDPLGTAVGGYVVSEMDFGAGSATPDDASMPTDWVDWYLGDGILNFNLGDGWASIPSGERPYLAFDTGSTAGVTTIMVRGRHHGAHAGFDTSELSAGWSPNAPANPGPSDVLLGAAPGQVVRVPSSSDGLFGAGQYRTVVWRESGSSPLGGLASTDAVADLQGLTIGAAKVESTTDSHLFIGFSKSCSTYGCDHWGSRPLYVLDFVRAWNSGPPPPPPDVWDARPVDLLSRNPDSSFSPMPATILPNSSWQVCVEVEITPPGHAPPSCTISVSPADPTLPSTQTQPYATGTAGYVAYCISNGQGGLATWQPVQAGTYTFTAQLSGGDDDATNDVASYSVDVVVNGCPVSAVDLPW